MRQITNAKPMQLAAKKDGATSGTYVSAYAKASGLTPERSRERLITIGFGRAMALLRMALKSKAPAKRVSKSTKKKAPKKASSKKSKLHRLQYVAATPVAAAV